jgi:23S rRNA pseudoU1915 N3-methylase RlmH
MPTRCWLTTHIYIVGKRNGAESWVAEGISEYEKRLQPVMQLESIFLKSDEEVYYDYLVKAYVILDSYTYIPRHLANKFSKNDERGHSCT